MEVCMSGFLKVKDVAAQLRVSGSTVRYYVNSGLLECNYTPKGQRVFTQNQVDTFLGKEENENVSVFYVRSSNGDKKTMLTQEELLKSEFGEPLKIYSDKASGLNENRKGLEKMMNDAKQGKFNVLCITNKDRLTRFGYKYIEEHLKTLNIEIKLVQEPKQKTLQEELLQDFMSLVASFSGKFYRLRGYEQQKKLLKKAEEQIHEND